MISSTAEDPARTRFVVYFIRRSAPSNAIIHAKGMVAPPSTPTLSSSREASPAIPNTCSDSAICPEPDFRAKELQQEVKNIEDGHKTLSDAKYQATVRRSPTKLNFGNPTADNFVLQKSEKATTEKHSVKHQKTRKDVSEAEEWSGLSNFSKKGGFDPNPSVVTCKYFPATATPRGYAYFKGKPPLRPFSRLGCYRAKTPMSKAPSSISTNAVQCEADRRVTVKLKKAEQSISAATMTKRSYSFAEFNRLNLKTNKQDQHTFLLKQMKEVQSKNNLRFVSFYKF